MTANSHKGAPPPPPDDGLRFEVIATPRGPRIAGIYDLASALPAHHWDIVRRRNVNDDIFVRFILPDDEPPLQTIFVETTDGKREYVNMCVVTFDGPWRRRAFFHEPPLTWPTDLEAIAYVARRPNAGFLTETLVPVVQTQREVARLVAFLDRNEMSRHLMAEIAPKVSTDNVLGKYHAYEDEIIRLRGVEAALRRQLASKGAP